MKCPKCGSEDFRQSIEKGTIKGKRLPIWIGVVMAISCFVLVPFAQYKEIAVFVASFSSLLFLSSIIYFIVRQCKISNEKELKLIQYTCKNCGYESYEKLS